MKKRKSYQILSGVRVEGIAGEGKGLARVDGKVVFVENGVPGDVGDVLLTQNKKDYAIGRINTLLEPSQLRETPFCKHFGSCGGCKWQNISYATQLQFKQGMVQEAFERIGKVDFPTIQPIMGCESDKYYRNKMEFTFSAFGWLSREQIVSGEKIDRRAVGFHVPGKYDMVAHIEECYLMDVRTDAIRNGLYRFACENGMTFYDLIKHTGLLRNLLVRATTRDEWMVVVAFSGDDDADMQAVMHYLHESFPFITCLQYTVNNKRNDAWNDLEIIHFAGNHHIIEEIGGVQFRISAQSFFQTNSLQARRLYDIVKAYAGLTGNEVVYDLYTGTGSIALYLAAAAGKVVGIEQIEKAVLDARHNASLNQTTNATFETGTVESLLSEEFIQEHGAPDVVITDPPRAGMHPRVVEVLLQALPKKIVYVSCNPSTQARDLQLLSSAYQIMALQPVDMFPQTWHIENVALLSRRES